MMSLKLIERYGILSISHTYDAPSTIGVKVEKVILFLWLLHMKKYHILAIFQGMNMWNTGISKILLEKRSTWIINYMNDWHPVDETIQSTCYFYYQNLSPSHSIKTPIYPFQCTYDYNLLQIYPTNFFSKY